MIQEKMQQQSPAWLERTEQLLGSHAVNSLKNAHVLIVGTGGVGAYAAEMICRAGIEKLTLVDADTIAESNINRQLPALHSTIGREKATVLAKRFTDINPMCDIAVFTEFLTPENMESFFENKQFDFIVDAIDTIAPKIALITYAMKHKIQIVSSMGAGAKTDITLIRQTDLWKTFHDGLAKAVRNKLSALGMKGKKLPVVFCEQQADRNALVSVDERNKKTTAGTISYMPATFGCFLAAYVIKKLSAK